MIETKEQKEFLLKFDYDNGSLPPPYHYEFSIWIEAQGLGRVSFLPDYPSPGLPRWEETFQVSTGEIKELIDLLVQKEALREHWPVQTETFSGGEWQRLEVCLQGKTYVVPGEVEPQTGEQLAGIYTYVRYLVPQQIWESLDERRRIYQKSFETE